MTLLNTVNVGGTDFKVAGVAILGSCPTPAGSEVKVCTFTDDFELKAGDMLLVKFTYANTYGDGSTTYPKLQVNGTNYTMRRADGSYIASGEWDNNATLTFLFDGTDFILPAGSLLLGTVDIVEEGNLHAVTSNAVAEALSYSTSEIDTGKKWIDGKTIYRKVVLLPFQVSVATSAQVSNEVSASDYQVIDLGHSYIYDADYGTRQPWASNATTQTNMYISSGRLSFETTHPSGTLYAVCEYTKTTPST